MMDNNEPPLKGLAVAIMPLIYSTKFTMSSWPNDEYEHHRAKLQR